MLKIDSKVTIQTHDFTVSNKAWNLISKDPERLLYVECTGTGTGIKTGDVIVWRHNERIVKSIINFIEHSDKETFRLTMLFLHFVN